MINNTRVVIADDMEPILLYLEKVISEVDEFELVGKARNGKELIDLVLKNKPDLVITDIEMPECNGVKAVEKLNDLGIKTKYIFITGNSSYVVTCKEKSMGVFKVIKKPILDDKNFINQIKSVMDMKLQPEKMSTEETNKEKCYNKDKNENMLIKIINKIFKSK